MAIIKLGDANRLTNEYRREHGQGQADISIDRSALRSSKLLSCLRESPLQTGMRHTFDSSFRWAVEVFCVLLAHEFRPSPCVSFQPLFLGAHLT
jgi:hypothetical protein